MGEVRGLAPLANVFIFPFGAFTLILSAGLALYSLRDINPKLKVLFVLPQQFLLLLSSFGAARAIVLSQFADGVVRPWQFIAVDQSIWLVLTTAYLYFLIKNLKSLAVTK